MNEEHAFYATLVNHWVRVFLVTGIKLQGRLIAQCDRALYLEDQDSSAQQLVYKRNITTVACDNQRTHRGRCPGFASHHA